MGLFDGPGGKILEIGGYAMLLWVLLFGGGSLIMNLLTMASTNEYHGWILQTNSATLPFGNHQIKFFGGVEANYGEVKNNTAIIPGQYCDVIISGQILLNASCTSRTMPSQMVP